MVISQSVMETVGKTKKENNMKRLIIIITMLLVLGFSASVFAGGQRSMCSHKDTKKAITSEMRKAIASVYNEEIADKYVYKLTKIRTTFNNSTTKAASCVAVLEISLDGNTSPVNIAYNVMPLDEEPGKFYVEILMAE